MTVLKNTQKMRKKGGRPPSKAKAAHRLTVRFTSEEYGKFISMFSKTEMKSKSKFIKTHFFGKEFIVRTYDDNTLSFYQELKNIRAECNKIGVNYNQQITILKKNFSEQKANYLVKQTSELFKQLLNQNDKALNITLQLVRRWLPK